MDDYNVREIARRFKQLREQNGLTIAEMAEAIGTGKVMTENIEAGLRGASMPVIIRASRHFGVSCDWIMCGGERPALETDSQRRSVISPKALNDFEEAWKSVKIAAGEVENSRLSEAADKLQSLGLKVKDADEKLSRLRQ